MAGKTTDTQAARRTKYGLNVAVTMIVATAIMVLLNALAGALLSSGPYRHDMTVTRQYSLSAQTLKVLQELTEPCRIVTVMATSGPYGQQAIDLVDEYAARGKHISAEHIVPGRDLGRQLALLQSMRDRFKEQLDPVHEAMRDLHDVLEKLRTDLAPGQQALLRQLIAEEQLSDESARAFAKQVASVYQARLGAMQRELAGVEQQLEQPMPDYAACQQQLETVVADLSEGIFAPTIAQFAAWAERLGTAAAVKEQLLGLIDQFSAASDQLQQAQQAMLNAELPQAYDDLLNELAQDNIVVISNAEHVRVLALADMFRQDESQELRGERQTQVRFLGEELLTGALVSTGLAHPPMVVFVHSADMPALGPRGTHTYVAERLRSVRFDVQQWCPTGQMGPMGQPAPPQPMPQPQADQQVIWVIMPAEPPNPMNPMASGSEAQIAEFVSGRLDAGDAALMILSPSQVFSFAPSPSANVLERFGVTAQLDRVILTQRVLPDQRKIAVNHHSIRTWPDASPITAALAGMPGVCLFASPLIIGVEADAKIVPLVTVSGEQIWAQTNPDIEHLAEATFDPAAAPPDGQFVVACAIQRNDQRCVVVADPLCFSDTITTNADPGLRAPGLAGILGAAYPGNAELFVNSVYWLAGLDQLIAASPRAQDIRRIDAISPGGLVALRWAMLVGMPAAALLLGGSVWWVRRRG